jgi:hypothetical protein
MFLKLCLCASSSQEAMDRLEQVGLTYLQELRQPRSDFVNAPVHRLKLFMLVCWYYFCRLHGLTHGIRGHGRWTAEEPQTNRLLTQLATSLSQKHNDIHKQAPPPAGGSKPNMSKANSSKTDHRPLLCLNQQQASSGSTLTSN